MKVLVCRLYVSKSDVVNYDYDSVSEVYHGFSVLEKVLDVSDKEFAELQSAVNYFNNKGKASYQLRLLVVSEDDEVQSLLSDYKNYLRKEDARSKKLKAEAEALQEAAKQKREAAKAKREAVKLQKDLDVLAKKLNMPLADLQAKLAKS